MDGTDEMVAALKRPNPRSGSNTSTQPAVARARIRKSYRHGDPGPPTIGKKSGHRSHEAINQDVKGKHQRHVSPAPAKLRQDGGEENRKGMANPVYQNHTDDAD